MKSYSLKNTISQFLVERILLEYGLLVRKGKEKTRAYWNVSLYQTSLTATEFRLVNNAHSSTKDVQLNASSTDDLNHHHYRSEQS
ncbi:hypothetical protein KY290_036690 [Solanum tuberosum]|uniref:Uncharacterized protein n=1 Tax=Solanum tuberosum TaxID=4113 RepID=A0ABQ7TU25_SOLTU|nr:hypothetical protein KY289_036176 [Solanum tuberosum]KAH0639423.1 hypothetical protein KY285_036009 [Solanum tuberosum]KAH0737985.1 hypothetical protein KY290_036690 [Solanum tuberosum]